MSEPIAPPTLQAIVTAFELKGAGVLGDLRDHPALVHCGGDASAQTWGFDTRAVQAPWDARVALALVRSGSRVNPELLAQAGSVYAVAKRPGGPFPDRIGVGRTRTADLSLRMPSVSKYHAYFSFDEAARSWSVVDARSRNGTCVGDRRLPPGEGLKLDNGANIMFGDEAFLFFTDRGFRELLETLVTNAAGESSRR